mmetsp:Transcript_38229/g.122948  ORF Transcript_38229/g.122948 Transcript_38229/m.122948 type:complete len:250 (-) Transcript_38229:106-855(-)
MHNAPIVEGLFSERPHIRAPAQELRWQLPPGPASSLATTCRSAHLRAIVVVVRSQLYAELAASAFGPGLHFVCWCAVAPLGHARLRADGIHALLVAAAGARRLRWRTPAPIGHAKASRQEEPMHHEEQLQACRYHLPSVPDGVARATCRDSSRADEGGVGPMYRRPLASYRRSRPVCANLCHAAVLGGSLARSTLENNNLTPPQLKRRKRTAMTRLGPLAGASMAFVIFSQARFNIRFIPSRCLCGRLQ